MVFFFWFIYIIKCIFILLINVYSILNIFYGDVVLFSCYIVGFFINILEFLYLFKKYVYFVSFFGLYILFKSEIGLYFLLGFGIKVIIVY